MLCGAVLGASSKTAVAAPVKTSNDSVLRSSATQLASMIRKENISSVELVSESIARIKEVDPKGKCGSFPP